MWRHGETQPNATTGLCSQLNDCIFWCKPGCGWSCFGSVSASQLELLTGIETSTTGSRWEVNLGFPWGLPPGPRLGSVPQGPGASGALRYLSGDTWGPCPQEPERCHREGDTVVPTAGSGPARRAGAVRAGEAIPPRYAAGGAGPFLRWTKARVRVRPRLPGPSSALVRRRWCPAGRAHAGVAGAAPCPHAVLTAAPAPARRGCAARAAAAPARHPRDAEPIRAPSGAAGPARPRPPPLGPESCGRGSAAAGARGRLAALHGDREPLQRGRFRALLGERRDGATAARLGSAAAAGVGTEGWRGAGWGLGGDGARGGCARGQREPAVQALPGQSAGAAVRPGRAGRERPRAVPGRAGGSWSPPGAMSPRPGRGASCAGFPAGRCLERERARGCLPSAGNELPSGRSRALPARLAARLRYPGVTAITVSHGCGHTRAAAGGHGAALSAFCRTFVQQNFRSSLTKSGERRCCAELEGSCAQVSHVRTLRWGVAQLRHGILCGSCSSEAPGTAGPEWKFISGANWLYVGCVEEGKSWKLGK